VRKRVEARCARARPRENGTQVVKDKGGCGGEQWSWVQEGDNRRGGGREEGGDDVGSESPGAHKHAGQQLRAGAALATHGSLN
jgi:hypothetical protein